MTDLNGKVVVVTGAASGIGEATAKALVEAGSKVVGCDIDEERLNNVAKQLNKTGPGEMVPIKCNVTIEDNVRNAFGMVEEKFGTLHAIVNSAGIMHLEPLLSGKTENWMKMLQVNVLGVATCAREAVQLMKKCGVDDGHVVNLGSLVGKIVVPDAGSHFYSATKFALSAMSEGLRQELRAEKSHIRVTTLYPSSVNTPLYSKVSPEYANFVFSSIRLLEVEDISQSILHALSAPARVDVSEIVIRSYDLPV